MATFRPLTCRLAEVVERSPDAEAICSAGHRVRYCDLGSEVSAVAGWLAADGLTPGDRVAVWLENSPDYVAAYYGTMAAGGVAVGLNDLAREREVAVWLAHSGARWLFTSAAHATDVAALLAASPGLRVVVRAPSCAAHRAWPRAYEWPAHAPLDRGPDDLAAIIYTSGTTGRPKGVALTHGNLAANTSGIVQYLGVTAGDRVLNVLPFFYSYGSSVLHTHLSTGGTVVLEHSVAYPWRLLDRMVAERITGFPGVPSTFALLLTALEKRRHDLSRLKYVTQAGGAMPPEQVRRLRLALPEVRVFVMYGQTEATARLTYLPPERLDEKLGSVGIPMPGVELAVCDEQGRRVPAGESGEVYVRGASIMAGYFRDPDGTAAVLHDGWLHTGDLGHLDRDGYLYLEGRRSDMIKSGAHRISPLEIEAVIAELPAVAEVVALGVPDEVLGESIKAVIRLRPDATLGAAAVQRHCMEQLPRYKVPRQIEFTDRFPRTNSGKIKRFELR